jgi:glycosyltransferase involved in cell wall biosynthesis
MRIAFLIPTYNRPGSLLQIVKKIHKLGDVYIVDDCGDANLSNLLQYGVKLFRNKEHNGKEKFYLTVNSLINETLDFTYDYYIFMPDDLIPVDGFLSKAIELWKGIKDNRKICLNLYLEKSRIGKACWTNFLPQDKGNVTLTNWVDMCFLCEYKMLKSLHYRIPEPKIDWLINQTMSSGVGRYISKFLVWRMHLTMYQVKSSLFVSAPESYKSQMHPDRGSDHLIYKEII